MAKDKNDHPVRSFFIGALIAAVAILILKATGHSL